MEKKITVLVTGGTGYIGSHAVLALLEKGFNVVSVDNNSNSYKENLNKDCKYYYGDFSDQFLLNKIHEENKIDAVMHFAGSIYVGESVQVPNLYFENNTKKTSLLVDWMKSNKINIIIFSSTAATYGNPKRIPIKEKAKQKPINPYGESKLRSEKYIKDSKLKYVIFRYFNVAGAHDSLKIGYNTLRPAAHLIPIVCETLLKKRKEMVVFGTDFPTKDGTAVRDYIHVQDLAEAHVVGLEYLLAGKKSNNFNLGSNTGFSNKEVLDTAEKVSKLKLNYEFGPRRDGDPAMLVASNKKVKRILNWAPKRNLEQMILSNLEWLKSKK